MCETKLNTSNKNCIVENTNTIKNYFSNRPKTFTNQISNVIVKYLSQIVSDFVVQLKKKSEITQ